MRLGFAAARPVVRHPPLSMLKALYLQTLYDLSDPGLEEALLDRLSFRRFCGFGADQPTPDETTICRFRAAAAAAGVLADCFAEVNQQLDANGLINRPLTRDPTRSDVSQRPSRPPHSASTSQYPSPHPWITPFAEDSRRAG